QGSAPRRRWRRLGVLRDLLERLVDHGVRALHRCAAGLTRRRRIAAVAAPFLRSAWRHGAGPAALRRARHDRGRGDERVALARREVAWLRRDAAREDLRDLVRADPDLVASARLVHAADPGHVVQADDARALAVVVDQQDEAGAAYAGDGGRRLHLE